MVRASASALLALAFCVPAPEASPRIRIHEWGTFTTLSTSDGEPLEGLFVDATRLPDFVHGLPFFNHGPAGWPSPQKLKGVTVKMETPVIYFYSDVPFTATVKVGFQGGTISQWFPQRHGGEANPAGPVVDLGAAPYQGSIDWKVDVLSPHTTDKITHGNEYSPATSEWAAPRLTQSNLVKGSGGEVEKFLFYRGLGNFESAVTLKFTPDGKLRVKNRGAEAIPFLLIYDRIPGPDIGRPPAIWWKGSLAAGEERIESKPANPEYQASAAAMEDLRQAMVKEGLYDDEARALLNTWYNGYFIEGGLKAFWIVPRKQVDRILPLQITPGATWADSLVRVIIGRSEILTPEFEARLVAEGGSLPSHAQDKYWLAYQDFLAKRAAPSGVTRMARPARAPRPWGLALPWEGLSASPSLREDGSRGSPILLDLQGRRLPQP